MVRCWFKKYMYKTLNLLPVFLDLMDLMKKMEEMDKIMEEMD